MTDSPFAVVVLAAGEGTRMVSRTPKVLHGFAGRSLLGHVLAATAPLRAAHTVVVVGHGRDEVTAHVSDIAPDAIAVVQEEQLGTGHAVHIALQALPADVAGTVIIVPADAPLLRPETLAELLAAHSDRTADVTVLSSVVPDPTGYGRLVRAADETVAGIVEHRDASAEQRGIAEVASGVYAVQHGFLRDAVGRLSSDNDQGEQYLPEIVAIARAEGRPIGAVTAHHLDTAGVNDRVQLAAAHRTYNLRLLESFMRAGVTVIDPASTWIDADVRLEPDVTVLPWSVLLGKSAVSSGAIIGPRTELRDTTVGADSRLTHTVAVSATVGAGVTVGPFAYLRPGTVLADGVHIGTFVEVKNSDIGTGSKVPHLSYVGDASIGEHTNIGAATVFVNYDGVEKHRTTIGDHARTGADNMFVAPVTVGDGAYTAAGSVITQDVPPGAMGVARAQQRNVKGWVARRRAGSDADKAAQDALARDNSQSTDDS